MYFGSEAFSLNIPSVALLTVSFTPSHGEMIVPVGYFMDLSLLDVSSRKAELLSFALH